MRKSNRSKKSLDKTSKMKAEKADTDAKRATAKGKLEEIGKIIAAHVKIMRDHDAAAEEKAGHELRKAQDERDTIMVLLVEARAKCREARESFETFRKQHCPDLGRSRLYAVLAIADGRKTVEQDRAEKRESVAKFRAKVSSTSVVVDGAGAARVPTPNGTTLDASGFSPGALEQIVKATGNGVDTEASAEARGVAASEPKARNTFDDEFAPDDVTISPITPSPLNQQSGAILTVDKLSDDALVGFKKACDEYLPAMTVVGDRRMARAYFMTACDRLEQNPEADAA